MTKRRYGDVEIGQQYGHLTVIDRAEPIIRPNGDILKAWLCECDCVNKTRRIVDENSLKYNHTKSCGCTRHKTHGLSYSRIYKIYYAMLQRCTNENYRQYNDYGGRGIKVCKEWQDDFMNFYNWAIENGYSDSLSIDRKNVNGDYCPENCMWSTSIEQANNKRNNIIINYRNESHTLKEWSYLSGIKYGTLLARFRKKWPIDQIFQNADWR